MDSELGSIDVKPDQMQLINPLLILLFIPLYDVLFYPLLSKIGIRRPLQKLTLGGILAGVAFILSGVVELELEKTYPELPRVGECQLRMFNTFPCDYAVQVNTDHTELQRFDIEKLKFFELKNIPVTEKISYDMTMSPKVSGNADCPIITGKINLLEKQAVSYFGQSGKLIEFLDDPNKSRTGDPVIRILVNMKNARTVAVIDPKGVVRSEEPATNTDRIDLVTYTYIVTVDGVERANFALKQGAVFTVLINDAGFSLTSISDPNSMHIFWLIPQYVVMTLGEVMYSVTGLQFSYAQAPVSMKSVIQACWLLTVAFGNLIDVIVVGSQAFDSQVNVLQNLFRINYGAPSQY